MEEKLKQADKDGDGKLSFEEVQSIIADITREYFDKLDVDGDGLLTLDEVTVSFVRPTSLQDHKKT